MATLPMHARSLPVGEARGPGSSGETPNAVGVAHSGAAKLASPLTHVETPANSAGDCFRAGADGIEEPGSCASSPRNEAYPEREVRVFPSFLAEAFGVVPPPSIVETSVEEGATGCDRP